MDCQVPGCTKKATRCQIETDEVHFGVCVGDIAFWYCGDHSPKELRQTFTHLCERVAKNLQETNPFQEVIAKKSAG